MNNAASCARILLRTFADGPLARGVTLALDVGGVLDQRQHAFFAVFRERMKIEKLVVGRSGINLEVAGVNDHAEWRMYRQCDAIHQAVRDLDGMYRERPNLEPFVRLISLSSASSSNSCSSSLSST